MQDILDAVLQLTGVKELKPFSPKLDGVLSLEVTGKDSEKIWQALRKLSDFTGYWPLIVGEEIEIFEEAEWAAPPSSELPEDWKRRIAAKTATEWFEIRLNSENSMYGESEFHGDWPEQANGSNRLTVGFEILSEKPKPRVVIALFPTREPWQIATRLGYGGWNECPSPEEHHLVMKYWFENYAAVPAGITRDVIEMVADRPPKTHEEATKLAREQFAYCDDIVTQGTQTIEALAAGLLNNPYWYFWWD